MAEGSSECDWCLRKQQSVTALWYCYDCIERLCVECVEFHSRARLNSNHKLLNIEGKNFTSETVEFIQNLKTCSKHQTENISYICKNHDKTCCSKCVIESHPACDRLVPLSVECGHRTTEPVCTTLKSVVELEENSQTLLTHEKNNHVVLSESKKSIIAELYKVKQEFDDAFKTLEHNVLASVDERSKCLHKASQTSYDGIEQVADDIAAVRNIAEMVDGIGDPDLCYLYDHQQRGLKTISGLRSKIFDLRDQVLDRDLQLVKIKSVSKICESISKCLKIEDKLSKPSLLFSESLASDAIKEYHRPSFRELKLCYTCDLGKSSCHICSCIWVNDLIILANNAQNELIQVESGQGSVVGTYQTDKYPTSIVMLDDTRIAVCYDTEYIDIYQLYTLKYHAQRLKLDKKMMAASLKKAGKQLVCLSRSSRCIDIISLTGDTVDNVPRNVFNDVTEPSDIEYDNNTDLIFLACHINSLIVVFDSKCKTLKKLDLSAQNIDIRGIHYPVSITVDINSQLYVVDGQNILHFDENLEFVQTLVPGTLGMPEITCLAFNKDMTQFALTGRAIDRKLKVFRFD